MSVVDRKHSWNLFDVFILFVSCYKHRELAIMNIDLDNARMMEMHFYS